MPNCFSLIDKQTGEAASLKEIDESFCKLCGYEPHPTKWVLRWDLSIGFRLAAGKSLDEIEDQLRETLQEFVDLLDHEGPKVFEDGWWNVNKKEEVQDVLKMIGYLKEHYITDAWCER